MAITPKPLWTAMLEAAPTELYAAGEEASVVIMKAVFANTTGSSVTLRVWKVPAGEAVGNVHTLIQAQSIAGGATYGALGCELTRQVLAAGDAIWAQASVGAAIAAIGSGMEITA